VSATVSALEAAMIRRDLRVKRARRQPDRHR
jgi:hypothetical protein